MKPATAATPSDQDQALRASLQRSWVSGDDLPGCEALQERVLAQWQQRHPGAEFALAGGPHASTGFRAPRWVLPVLLLAISLSLLGWWNRPDPALEELMQLDVLSQMALGEM